MKVLMQGRSELLKGGGGDKVQITNTAQELIRLGVDVTFCALPVTNYAQYDLVHFFQLDWTPDPSIYAKNVKEARVPLVFSPIHHNIEEVKRFDKEYTFGFRTWANILFKSQFKKDTLKNIYKSVRNPHKIIPTLRSIFKGLKKIHADALRLSDHILVQTELEAKDLRSLYGVNFEWSKVPNRVSAIFLPENTQNLVNPMPFENYILCVGRIEARKNQLTIISAVTQFRERTGRDVQLVFIGQKSTTKHLLYIKKFEKAVSTNAWIHYLGPIDYNSMPAYYKHAKVCVSASWFETTGLTSLEALFCATNAVASGARAKEYLGDYVSYCDPGSSETVFQAILKEYDAKRPVIDASMLREYTWDNAAKKTLQVYKEVLNNA